jgi:ferrochelatase
MGGASPILPNTQAQAKALEMALADLGEVKCFIAMRYWHPFASEVAEQIKAFAPDQIIEVPLYPQFSTSTTDSSHKDLQKALGKAYPVISTCCYFTDSGFIKAQAEKIRPYLEQAKQSGHPVRLLLSAHGLPEKIIKAGDPYQFQCEQTAKAIIAELGYEGDWLNSYQSRVGPLKWIGPSTEDEVERAGHDKVALIVVPIAFVSEHSETLVELDIEYAELAHEKVCPIMAACLPWAITRPLLLAWRNWCATLLPGRRVKDFARNNLAAVPAAVLTIKGNHKDGSLQHAESPTHHQHDCVDGGYALSAAPLCLSLRGAGGVGHV